MGCLRAREPKLGRRSIHTLAISWFRLWDYLVQVLGVIPCIYPMTSIRILARAIPPDQRWRGRSVLKHVGPFFGTYLSASCCCSVLICFHSQFRAHYVKARQPNITVLSLPVSRDFQYLSFQRDPAGRLTYSMSLLEPHPLMNGSNRAGFREYVYVHIR